ncbi:hypothetical protein ABZV14_02195 [Streptosporangium canum]|uniref:hypothetical protein n=1 Tax=Streptosporangium canum TaxID=324952 RepID=UPI0033A5EFDD
MIKLALSGVVVAALVCAAASAPAFAASPREIPKSFLKYEHKEAQDKVFTWKVSDKAQPLALLTDCPGKRPSVGKAEDTRTVTASGDSDYRYVEQLIIMPSPEAAQQVVKGTWAGAAACNTKKLAVKTPPIAYLGDEAFTFSAQDITKDSLGGAERAVVVRKGSSLLVYSQSTAYGKVGKHDFGKLLADARAMVPRLCQAAKEC